MFKVVHHRHICSYWFQNNILHIILRCLHDILSRKYHRPNINGPLTSKGEGSLDALAWIFISSHAAASFGAPYVHESV
jgi:hypothetical protein